jgi:cell division control protein 6
MGEGGEFRDLLMGEETLFREERVFDLDYVPERYLHRDGQKQEIAFCLRPALRGGRPLNARILGPPATGKTTAIRLLFDEIESLPEGRKLLCVHVNCQIHTSKFTIFSQIHKKLQGHLPPETGVPFPRVYEAIFRRLVKEGRSLVVALDDMNYLFYDRHANEVLYDLLRAHEVFPGAKTAVLGILSDTDFRYKLDPKTDSMYRPREIFFPPYTRGEILDILRERARAGLYPGVASEAVLEWIAEYAASQGDLRGGIELLRIAALLAEGEASRKIEIRHVEKASQQSRSIALRSLLETLSPEEQMLLKVLSREESRRDSGELYRAVREEKEISYTKFYRILEKLEALRLIDTKFTGEGKRGRTRNIIPRHPGEEVLAILEGFTAKGAEGE